MKKYKKIPRFKNEDQERKFWSKHDSTLYLNWSKAEHALFPNLKPSTKTISLRLPEQLLNSIKVAAHKRAIPYQTFIKMLLHNNFTGGKSKFATT